ncbi:MAG TPA: isoprenylcysteine carboxylmethyltransferase family protein [Thermoanaerobaculia bacterium]|jgi:protein-S-isoprenylcysteine O-methyltransferase Ste14|nr:isoprenylcysteine carboxylmethyltransferase family protein [Thermoanaerobaculia bacterium]
MRTGIRVRLYLTRLLAVAVLATVLMSASHWTLYGPEPVGDWLFAAGALLAVVGFGGRTWAHRHIGGRKKRQLVRTGPYAVCRHPLYLGSLVGGLGLVLSTQRLSLVAVYLAGCVLLVPPTIRTEEAFLAHQFDDYADYRASVPALFPRWPWVPGGAGAVDFRALGRGVLETAVFLSPLLLLPLVAELQRAGTMPFFVVLP